MPSRKKAAKKATSRPSKKATREKGTRKKAAKKSARKAATKSARKPAARKKTVAKKKTGAKKKTAAGKKAGRKATAKKKTAARKAGRRGRAHRAPRQLKSVSVGDAVRIPPDARGLRMHEPPASGAGLRAAEAIEGTVISIRNIATGRLVQKSRGDLSGYVLEVVHNETFTRLSSDRNLGGRRNGGRAPGADTQARLTQLLQELASKGELPSAAAGDLSQEPFHSLLDGWRVVKVKAEQVEAAEERRSV